MSNHIIVTKRYFALLLCIAVLLTMVLPVSASADVVEFGDYTYTDLDDGTVSITKYNGSDEEVVIPSEIDGKSVTHIGSDAFRDNTDLMTVVFPEAVTGIASYAFSGCKRLKDLNLPGSLKSIGMYAFSNCKDLREIRIPQYVTDIGEAAFINCSSNERFEVDDMNEVFTSVDGVLYNKDVSSLVCCPCAMHDVDIPDSVTSLENRAFEYCKYLTHIDIPENVEMIDKYVFVGCSALNSINVAENNMHFSSHDGVLYDKDVTTLIACPGAIKYLTVPDTVTTIGYAAMHSCKSLDSVLLPASVATISNIAFKNCKNLRIAAILGSDVDIKDASFDTDTDLTIYAYLNSSAVKYALEKKIKCAILPEVTYSELEDGTLRLDEAKMCDSTWVWGEYGGWSPWQNSAVTASESREVGTQWITNYKTQYNYSKWTANSNGTGWTGPSKGTWSGYYCGTYVERGWTDTPLAVCDTSQGFNIYGTMGKDPWYNEVTRQAENGGYTQYRYRDREKIYTYYDPITALVIPDENDGKTVTAIGERVFNENTALQYIDFPETITALGNEAFRNCTALKDVNLSYSITDLGESTFSGCTSLKSIYLHENIEKLRTGTFYNCSSLEKINIPESVTALGSSVFNGCSGLTDITIPDSVEQMGNYVFLNCTALKNVNIGNSVKELKTSVFSGCTSLETIDIPESVTTIGETAFGGCTALKRITLPSSVVSIAPNAFEDCPGVTIRCEKSSYAAQYAQTNNISVEYSGDDSGTDSPIEFTYTSFLCTIINDGEEVAIVGYKEGAGYDAVIPDEINGRQVTEISDRAFAYERDLGSIVIPETVRKIGSSAFERCEMLREINIPASVEEIGEFAFARCPLLESINVSADNPEYASKDGILYNKDFTRLIVCPTEKQIADIPGTVESIAPNAFEECSNITDIAIPDNVRRIEEETFFGCQSLAKATLPDGLAEIGERAFTGCSSLRNINIPDSVFTIEDSAFSHCTALEDLFIPDSVEQIGDSVFYETPVTIRCSSRSEAYLYAKANGIPYMLTPVPDVINCTVMLSNDSFTYDGGEITPYVVVTDEERELTQGVDYTVSYENNIDPGTATVVVSGIGDYVGVHRENFYISSEFIGGKSVTQCDVYLDNNSFTYDADEKTPAVTVKYGERVLEENVDYTVEYINNIDPGDAVAVVHGIGDYVDFISVHFMIKDNNGISISACDISLDKDSYYYNGDAVTPVVTVKDGEYLLDNGNDYVVTYENNTGVGTALAVVRGKGDYSGKEIIEFTIKDPGGDHDEYTKIISCGEYGDVDGDGVVTSGDALSVLRASIGLDETDELFLMLGDIDGDEQIMASDALAILRYSIGFSDGNKIGETAEKEVSAVTWLYIKDQTGKDYYLSIMYWGKDIEQQYYPGVPLTDKDGDGWYEAVIFSTEKFNWKLVGDESVMSVEVASQGDKWVVLNSMQNMDIYDYKPDKAV